MNSATFPADGIIRSGRRWRSRHGRSLETGRAAVAVALAAVVCPVMGLHSWFEPHDSLVSDGTAGRDLLGVGLRAKPPDRVENP